MYEKNLSLLNSLKLFQYFQYLNVGTKKELRPSWKSLKSLLLMSLGIIIWHLNILRHIPNVTSKFNVSLMYGMIWCAFKQAFYCVCHHTLLTKLHFCNFSQIRIQITLNPTLIIADFNQIVIMWSGGFTRFGVRVCFSGSNHWYSLQSIWIKFDGNTNHIIQKLPQTVYHLTYNAE